MDENVSYIEVQILKKRDLRKILDEYNLATKGEVETIQSKLTDKIGNIETRIGDLVKNQDDFDKLRREKDEELKTERERLNGEKEKALNDERERLNDEKEKALNDERERLNGEKEKALNDERERLNGEKEKALNDERERLNGEKEKALNDERERLNGEKEKALNDERERLNGEKEKALNDERERLNGEKADAVQAAIKPWEDFAAPYKPVQEAMENCETFRSLLDKRNLTNIRGYIRAIGETVDFAKAVYTAAKEFKLQYKDQGKDKPESMTDSEKAVYKVLNSCYREILGIDFDIFVMPGDKSVDEEFTRLPFNKDKVEYMLKPADKNFRFTQEVYVPMLKTTTGSMVYKAQVSAGNM